MGFSASCSVDSSLPWAAGGQPPSPGFSIRTEGEPLLGHLEHLLYSCCSCLGALRAVSLIFFLTPHCQAALCPFLNTLFLQHHHLGCQGLSQGLWWGHWICLEWTVASKGSLGCLPQTSLQHLLPAPGHPHVVEHGPDRTKLFGHSLVPYGA